MSPLDVTVVLMLEQVLRRLLAEGPLQGGAVQDMLLALTRYMGSTRVHTAGGWVGPTDLAEHWLGDGDPDNPWWTSTTHGPVAVDGAGDALAYWQSALQVDPTLSRGDVCAYPVTWAQLSTSRCAYWLVSGTRCQVRTLPGDRCPAHTPY